MEDPSGVFASPCYSRICPVVRISTKYRSTYDTNGETHIPSESEEEYENGVCGVFTVMSSVCQKPRAEWYYQSSIPKCLCLAFSSSSSSYVIVVPILKVIYILLILIIIIFIIKSVAACPLLQLTTDSASIFHFALHPLCTGGCEDLHHAVHNDTVEHDGRDTPTKSTRRALTRNYNREELVPRSVIARNLNWSFEDPSCTRKVGWRFGNKYFSADCFYHI